MTPARAARPRGSLSSRPGSAQERARGSGFVAARLGYSDLALRYFRQTAAIDLADTHVAIDGGVHIAL
jgi:hypothetical protein